MPAPVAIRDPATYYETQKDPSAALGFADPVAPVRSLLSMHQTGSTGQPKTAVESIRQTNHSDLDLDISMNPRLLGYVCSCISSVVGTISSTIFYLQRLTPATASGLDEYLQESGSDLTSEELNMAKERIGDMVATYDLYFSSGGNIVQSYKVYGSIAISGLLTLITLAIVIAHFDSFCCVKKNRISFRDGSKVERNLLLTLIILSVIALFTSTGKFSVGEAQANVFFSTWTNFISCAINYEVWRKGSGRHHSFQNVIFGKKRHWFLLSIFSTISFFSTIDFFVNNNIIHDSNNFDCIDLRWTNQWIWLSMGGCVVCWATVLLHRYCKPLLVVSILEAIVSLAIIVVNGYVVAAFTGGNLDQVPCPSNLYFSVWGAFFLSVWILSTIIQEGSKKVDLDG